MFKQKREETHHHLTRHMNPVKGPCIIDAPLLWKLQYAEGNYNRKSTLNTSNSEVFIIKITIIIYKIVVKLTMYY